MNIEIKTRELMINRILEIIDKGDEAVVRIRSKSGEKYIEIVEQQFSQAKKFELNNPNTCTFANK